MGRAGRGLDAAYGALLSGAEDTEITDFFIRNALPTPDEVQQVTTALEQEPDGLTESEILRAVNLNRERIRRTVKLLSLESPPPVVRQDRKWQLTSARLSSSFWERREHLTNLRLREQQDMQDYVAQDSGHMAFLIRALDGDPETAHQPDLRPLSETMDAKTVREAVDFLRRTSIPIEPRKRWEWPKRRNIPVQRQAEPGRALCYWGDAGWSRLVRAGKYDDNRFADELVSAAAQAIREWQPTPSPTWVTCIPSRRRPNLVPDFAERLAAALILPFHPCLVKTADRPEQKSRANSAQQARNVEGSLGFSQNPVLPAPVLLVDDMVDSRWTFTVAASLLRERGCSAVIPFALANTGNG